MGDKLRKLIRLLIILVGAGILVYPSVSEYLSEKNSSRAVASYDTTIVEMEQARRDKLIQSAIDYNKMLAPSVGSRSLEYDENGKPITSESYREILDIVGNGMMGYISVPKLNVTIPIYHGTSEAVLQVGIGHLENSSFPVGGESTHACLSGHRGLPTAELFTDLDRMKTGDIFFIKILDRTLCYKVDQILTVLPQETQELAIVNGKDYITLITCTPYGVNSHRLLVRGVRQEYAEEAPIPIYETDLTDSSFWSNLPAQYRHMLIGVAAVLIFLILRRIVIIIKNTLKKRRNTLNE